MLKGYVAFLDVLGFSAMVSGDTEGKHVDAYLAALEETLKPLAGAAEVEYVVFSDSIVLTTGNESKASLQALIRACSSLFGRMLGRKIALRGAIAHGPYIRSETKNGVFVAGRAIIEAYEFESRQDWVGIMLAPSVLRQMPEITEWAQAQGGLQYTIRPNCDDLLKRIDWAAFLREYEIPFKSPPGSTYSGVAIVPTHGQAEPNALLSSLETSHKQLLRLRSIAPTPEAQRKYDQSLQLLRVALSVWANVAQTLRE